MADYRINIGNGLLFINSYSATREAAEETMHDIIRAVHKGEICVEQKSETWERLPT